MVATPPVPDRRVIDINASLEVGRVADTNNVNDTASESTDVLDREADLSAAIAESADPIFVGDTVTYTVTAGNSGPFEADAVLDLSGPDDMVVTDSQVCVSTRSITPGTFQCRLGTFSVGDVATLTVEVTPTIDGPITLSAFTNSLDTKDFNDLNDRPVETTTVNPREADLSVMLAASDDSIWVGDPVTYTIVVANDGPLPADTRLTFGVDTSADVSFVAPSVCDFSSTSGGQQIWACPLGVMDVGAAHAVTVVVVVTPTQDGQLRPYVEVRSLDTEDFNSQNDFDGKTTTIVREREADLSVLLTSSLGSTYVDEPVTYTMVVTNLGPLAADTILNLGIESSASVTVTGCELGHLSGTRAFYDCELGVLDVGPAHARTFTATVTPTEVGELTPFASVFSPDTRDRNDLNDFGALTIPVGQRRVDASVLINESADPVLVGQPIVYTLVVANEGPSPAQAVLEFWIPTGPMIRALDCRLLSGAGGLDYYTCDLGILDVGPGGTRNIDVTVTPSTLGQVDIGAEIHVLEADDSDPGDDTADETTQVVNTPTGLNVVMPLPPVTVTFGEVTQAGMTTVVPSSNGPAPPTGFLIGNPPTYFEIDTTAQFTGTARVCIDYSGVAYDDESRVGLQHFDPALGAWVDVTDPNGLDTQNDIVCGSVASFSPFAVFERVNQPPVVTNPGNQGNTEGDGVTLQIEVADIDSPVLSYGVAGLPDGLTIDATGTISGRLPYNVAGVYTVTVLVRDEKATVSITFTWTIEDGSIGVTKTADTNDGVCHLIDCSLREAIEFANTHPGVLIRFKIPLSDPGFASGVYTIQPTTALPAITADGVTIDGASQTLATGDTNPDGPEIVINGALLAQAPAIVGFQIDGDDILLRNMVINGFNRAGCAATAVCDGIGVLVGQSAVAWRVALEGLYVGTDPSGTSAVPNWRGVVAESLAADLTIGGLTVGAGNLISGNLNDGITIIQPDASVLGRPTVVLGNTIGTDRQGLAALPNDTGIFVGQEVDAIIGGAAPGAANLISGNGGTGIFMYAADGVRVLGNFVGTDTGVARPLGNQQGILVIDSHDVVIGGLTIPERNFIGFNAGDGVRVTGAPPSPRGTAVLGNTIFSNDGLGINLGSDQVTPNDPGDVDTGPNGLQNFPVLYPVPSTGTQLTFGGTLESLPNSTYRLEFFTSVACDASGYGEGGGLLASFDVTTDGSGTSTFGRTLSATAPVGFFVTATATDPNDNTSEFSACVPIVVDEADLTTSVTAAPDPVASGEPLVYTTTVTNLGPAPARDVILTNTLEEGLTYLGNPGGSRSGNVVTWDLGLLPPQETRIFTVTVSSSATGITRNTATVTTPSIDQDLSNNFESISTVVTAAVDLVIEKFDNLDPVGIGQEFTYSLRIRNTSGTTATNLVVTDTLPALLEFRGASPGCSFIASTVRCVIAELPVNFSEQILIDVAALNAGSVTNVAQVSADQADADTDNNTATEETTVVVGDADLRVTISDAPDPIAVHRNELLTYTVIVENQGPARANQVQLTGTLDADASIVQVSAPGGTCNYNSIARIVDCGLGDIEPGAVRALSVKLFPTTNRPMAFSVGDVTARQSDPQRADNTAREETLPVNADLAVSLSASHPIVVLFSGGQAVPDGARVTYTIDVTNNGPSRATSVEVESILQGAYAFSDASAQCTAVPDVIFGEPAHRVTCNLPQLLAGETVTLTVGVDADLQPQTGVISHSVLVRSPEPDTDASNDTAQLGTLVVPSTDLAVSMVRGAGPCTPAIR